MKLKANVSHGMRKRNKMLRRRDLASGHRQRFLYLRRCRWEGRKVDANISLPDVYKCRKPRTFRTPTERPVWKFELLKLISFEPHFVVKELAYFSKARQITYLQISHGAIGSSCASLDTKNKAAIGCSRRLLQEIATFSASFDNLPFNLCQRTSFKSQSKVE